MTALSLIPKDDPDKLEAVIQMTLGIVYLEILKFVTYSEITEEI